MIDKVKTAIELIKSDSLKGKKLLAFSGGKDAIVVAHLMKMAGIDFKAVCETSFYFPLQLESIKKVAVQLDIDVDYMDSLSHEWLLSNNHIIFSSETKVRAWTFQVRQQATVKKYAKDHGYPVQFFGRRTEENSVKATIYATKAGMQCHPIRDWSLSEVWNYIREMNITIPFIYQTEFGETEGNAPFYTLNRKNYNYNIDTCWQVINQADPDRIFESKYRNDNI